MSRKFSGLDQSCLYTSSIKTIFNHHGRLRELEEISSLLLNIDDEIEVTLQFDDEDELCRLLKEEFILPELPSVEDTTQVDSTCQRQSNKKFNQKPFFMSEMFKNI